MPYFLFFLPFDRIAYLRSLASSMGFASNVYFWQVGGYFGTADALKPLLHTWSLAVEAQFYVIFPLIILTLFLLLKRSIYWVRAIIALSCVFSLTAAITLTWIGATDPVFFLLPFRIWEFGLGVLMALLTKSRIGTSNPFTYEVFFICLILSFFLNIPSLLSSLLIVVFGGLLIFQNQMKSNFYQKLFYLNHSITSVKYRTLYIYITGP